MVQAMHTYATNMQPQCKLLFGLDANSHAHADNDQLGVLEFAYFYTSKKLNSCYGPTPNPLNFTTFHARTHLQPQLNKVQIKQHFIIFLLFITFFICLFRQ